MKVNPLAGLRSMVVVAPHSDDETIAAHSLIQRLRRQGTRVSVIIVTDGSASHRNSPSWPKARLVRERRRESLRALRAIGVPQQDVRFLDFADGGLDSLSPSERLRLARVLGRGRDPDLVITPDRTDAHPDHRDVAAACADAWPKRVRRWSYVVWRNPAAPSCDASAAVTLQASPTLKRMALRSYRTQTGLIDDDPRGFHLTAQEVSAKCGPTERFSRVR